jgi:hypothetical protein
MSGEWKRDLRAPAPFLDSTAKSQATDEDFDASLVAEVLKNPELVKRIREQRDPVAKR